MNNNSTREEKLRYVISMGAEIAGGAVGGALGLLTANPFLIVGLGAVGAGISKSLIDTTEKYLSNREIVRTGAAAAETINRINERLTSGEILRNDGFFEGTSNSRSHSEELFEGVLISSKNEHEEKKVRYIANIFSSTVFSTISNGQANHVLRIANNITYRQMCVLGLIPINKTLLGISLEKKWLRDNDNLIPNISMESISLRQEIMDMYSQGLVVSRVVEEIEEEGWQSARISQEDDNLAMLSWYDVVPAGLKLTDLGNLCYELMSLKELSDNDIIETARLLEI